MIVTKAIHCSSLQKISESERPMAVEFLYMVPISSITSSLPSLSKSSTGSRSEDL